MQQVVLAAEVVSLGSAPAISSAVPIAKRFCPHPPATAMPRATEKRLLWVDAQGARVAPTGSRHLPALRFFLGPPDDAQVVTSVARSAVLARVKKKQAARSPRDLTEPHAAIEVPSASLRAEPSEQDHVAGSTESDSMVQDADALLKNQLSVSCEQTTTLDLGTWVSAIDTQPKTSAATAPVDDSSLAPSQVQSDVAALTVPRQEAPALATESATACAETPAGHTAAQDEQALSVGPLTLNIDDSSSSPPTVTVQLGPKTIKVAEAAWTSVQAQLTAAHDGASCIPTCSPPLTDAELTERTGIILHTEKCAAFMHELDCFHARVIGKPPLDVALQPGDLNRIRFVACDPRLNRAAIDLRGMWIGLHMQGPDVMFHLPPPFVSLTQVDAGRITSILNSPAKRAYAAYSAARVEALQMGCPLPAQPDSDLHPKVRRQIHQLFSDARLLTLMAHGLWRREAEAARKSDTAASRDAGLAPTASR